MSLETFYLGPTPSDEECAQTTDENFHEKNLAECKRYIELLRKKFGNEPEGAKLKIKSESHDFGAYREVVVQFDPHVSEGCEWAFKVESNAPQTWSDL